MPYGDEAMAEYHPSGIAGFDPYKAIYLSNPQRRLHLKVHTL